MERLSTIIDAIERGQGFPYMIAGYAILLLAERGIFALAHRGRWHEGEAFSNLGSNMLNAVFDAVIGAALFTAIYAAIWSTRLTTVPFGLAGWLFAFLLHDLCYYADHRVAHRAGLFWAMHSVHHSCREMNTLVAARGIFLDKSGLSAPIFLLMPLLGISFPMFLVVRLTTNLWGIFNHTPLVGRMGLLNAVMATPSNHRVHHGTEHAYRDRNYGQVWIVWDRLLGTYAAEDTPPTYGLPVPVESRNPFVIQAAGFRWLAAKMRNADGWLNKLACLWMPPDWQPSPLPLRERGGAQRRGEGALGPPPHPAQLR